MIFLRKTCACIFTAVAYFLLNLFGWKRNVVAANVNHIGLDVEIKSFYKSLLKNLVGHFSEILFHFGTFKKLPRDLGAYPCKVDGWAFDLAEGSSAVLERMGEGGVFLTAHYGNYEAMGPWLVRLGIPLVASYAPIKPSWLNRILEGKIRAVDGAGYSIHAKSPREFLRLLDEKKLFCLIADQDSRIPSAGEDKFFGKPVGVNPLPDFLLKYRPHTPVFFCFIEERLDCRNDCKNGSPTREKIRVLHAKQVLPPDDPSKVTDSEIPRAPSVMSRYNSWLETMITENPAFWYGFTHRRFFSKAQKIYFR